MFRVNSEIFNLSIYYGCGVTELEETSTGVSLKIGTRKHALFLNTVSGEVINLKSPEKEVITGKTAESLSSTIEVSLHNINENRLFYSGTSSYARLEIMAERNLLIKGLKLS